MSVEAVNAVLGAQLGMGPVARLVLLTMADYARADGGGVWVTSDQLAKDTEIPQRTVERVLARLRKAEFIAQTRRGRKHLGGSVHAISLARLAECSRTGGWRVDRSARQCGGLSAQDATGGGLTDSGQPAISTPQPAISTPQPATQVAGDPKIRRSVDSPPQPPKRARRARGAREGGEGAFDLEASLASLAAEPGCDEAVTILLAPVLRLRKLAAPNPAYAISELARWAADLPTATLKAAAHRLLETRHSQVETEHFVAAVRGVQENAGLPRTVARPGAPPVSADGLIAITERDNPREFAAWLAVHRDRRRRGLLHQVNLAEKHGFMRVPTLYPAAPSCSEASEEPAEDVDPPENAEMQAPPPKESAKPEGGGDIDASAAPPKRRHGKWYTCAYHPHIYRAEIARLRELADSGDAWAARTLRRSKKRGQVLIEKARVADVEGRREGAGASNGRWPGEQAAAHDPGAAT